MARVVDDHGHVGRATKPLGLRVYEPGNLPDPAQCAQSLIIVNDRSDGVPRARLALSNGASWDLLAFTTEHVTGQSTHPGLPQITVDVRPMIERAVAERLPALVSAMTPALLQGVQGAPGEMRVVSAPFPPAELTKLRADNQELVQTVLMMAQRLAALEERLDFVEVHGATTEIEMRMS